MATIRVRGKPGSVPSSPARSILVCLQRAGVRIQTKCGGHALCGMCAIRVHSGSEALSPRRPAEIERLQLIGATTDMRLACQTYTRDDVEIEIVNPGQTTRGAP